MVFEKEGRARAKVQRQKTAERDPGILSNLYRLERRVRQGGDEVVGQVRGGSGLLHPVSHTP